MDDSLRKTSVSKCEELREFPLAFFFSPTDIKFNSDNITFSEVSVW